MSLSAVSPGSLLDASYYTSLFADAGEVTATDVAAAAAGTAGTAGISAGAKVGTGDATLSGITSDLATLLRALAFGDTSGAKSDLGKLKADLKMQVASVATGSGSSAGGTSDPLNDLLSQMTTSLESGSTSGALRELAKYFVQNGQSTGVLVSTMA